MVSLRGYIQIVAEAKFKEILKTYSFTPYQTVIMIKLLKNQLFLKGNII